MDFYTPRKILFKAWDMEARLLVRLDSVPCVKGQLVKKDHILLQFTDFRDKHQEDIYEMDILLHGARKLIVHWSQRQRTWYCFDAEQKNEVGILTEELACSAIRLCSFFESGPSD